MGHRSARNASKALGFHADGRAAPHTIAPLARTPLGRPRIQTHSGGAPSRARRSETSAADPRFGIAAKPQFSPGVLNVLAGDISVTVRSAISWPSVANGICLRGSSIRSQWISSEHTTRRWRSQTSAKAVNSSASKARPTGSADGRTATTSSAGSVIWPKPPESNVQRPCSRINGTVLRARPVAAGAERNGGYTGTKESTSSWTSAYARHARCSPGTNPGSRTIHSASICQP